MEWISSTLSENNHTFLVCCGLWHEKPTFVASCGLIKPHVCGPLWPCRGLTRMFSLQKIASRSEDHSEFSSL